MTNLKNILMIGGLAGSLVLGGCGDKEKEINGKVIDVIYTEKFSKIAYEIQSKDRKIFANIIPNSPIWKGDSIQILNYSILDENGINYWKQEFNQGELKNAMYINIEKYKLPDKKSTMEIIEEALGRTTKQK